MNSQSDLGGDDGARRGSLIPGAEPRSHHGSGSVGLLLVHGFTGTPASLAPIADAAAAADVPMELPLLSGHGTEVGDLASVRWADWMGDVERAAARLSERCERIVICGQSMGGALALGFALGRSADTTTVAVTPSVSTSTSPALVAGIVAINPLTKRRSSDEMELIDGLIEDGIEVAPGGDSDIADPEARDVGYSGTPLRALRSALVEGIEPIAERYCELTVPLVLFTSRQDHVVEPSNSEWLAATYGGPLQHLWLERSFHVAAIDFDRKEIASGTLDLLSRVSP